MWPGRTVLASTLRRDSARAHPCDDAFAFAVVHSYVDLNKKLKQWENFYNFGRPHTAHSGKTPYEAPVDKMR